MSLLSLKVEAWRCSWRHQLQHAYLTSMARCHGRTESTTAIRFEAVALLYSSVTAVFHVQQMGNVAPEQVRHQDPLIDESVLMEAHELRAALHVAALAQIQLRPHLRTHL